jgi:hypothetical protein
MTRTPTESSCADVRAGSSQLVSAVCAALVLAVLLAGTTLGVARLLLVLVRPAESQLQQYLAELALSQTAAREP